MRAANIVKVADDAARRVPRSSAIADTLKSRDGFLDALRPAQHVLVQAVQGNLPL